MDIDIRKELEQFSRETIQQLRVNMKTQRVWPREVYPRYSEINEVRRTNDMWYSTGKGLDSLEYHIRNSRLDTAHICFFFLEYLRYVDIGVGKGRKAEDIDRSRKARYRSRYAKWDIGGRRTHRPAFMMEFRHLQQRLGWFAQNEYGYSARAYLMEGLKEFFKEV